MGEVITARLLVREPAEDLVRALREKLREIPGVLDIAVTFEGRRAPVQQNRGYAPAGTVAWEAHESAWANYAACGHGSQSAERLAERGGVSHAGVQCALAGPYNKKG